MVSAVVTETTEEEVIGRLGREPCCFRCRVSTVVIETMRTYGGDWEVGA